MGEDIDAKLQRARTPFRSLRTFVLFRWLCGDFRNVEFHSGETDV